ncbi:hypothetical protein AB1Y20_007797 [Prymnesium parvum]|uniref:Ribosome biogenesis protein NOP53 n=1 Tax=Prymnesium parvum TaxID=97485 RepID=A0AB34IUT3_PRYPA
MARRGAARREKRLAKREIAKEERGNQKYKNQKGSISKRERKRGKSETWGGRAESEAADEMVVIRNGKPVKLSGEAGSDSADEAEEPPVAERFTRAQKKLRALQKKLRDIEALKASRKQGVALDPQQQAKLRGEGELLKKLQKIESVVQKEKAEAEERGDADEAAPSGEAARRGAAAAEAVEPQQPQPRRHDAEPQGENAAGVALAAAAAEGSGMSKLAQRRALKLQKKQERLNQKLHRVIAKEERAKELSLKRKRAAEAATQKKIGRTQEFSGP